MIFILIYLYPFHLLISNIIILLSYFNIYGHFKIRFYNLNDYSIITYINFVASTVPDLSGFPPIATNASTFNFNI